MNLLVSFDVLPCGMPTFFSIEIREVVRSLTKNLTFNAYKINESYCNNELELVPKYYFKKSFGTHIFHNYEVKFSHHRPNYFTK